MTCLLLRFAQKCEKQKSQQVTFNFQNKISFFNFFLTNKMLC